MRPQPIAGNDTLDGGIGNDTIFGNAGADILARRCRQRLPRWHRRWQTSAAAPVNDSILGDDGTDTLPACNDGADTHFRRCRHRPLISMATTSTLAGAGDENRDLDVPQTGDAGNGVKWHLWRRDAARADSVDGGGAATTTLSMAVPRTGRPAWWRWRRHRPFWPGPDNDRRRRTDLAMTASMAAPTTRHHRWRRGISLGGDGAGSCWAAAPAQQ